MNKTGASILEETCCNVSDSPDRRTKIWCHPHDLDYNKIKLQEELQPETKLHTIVPIKRSPGSAAADGNDRQPLQLPLPPFLPRHGRSPSVLKQRRGGRNGDGDGNLPNSTLEVAVEEDQELPRSATVKQEEGKAALGAEGSRPFTMQELLRDGDFDLQKRSGHGCEIGGRRRRREE
jgi:hypothetical protein